MAHREIPPGYGQPGYAWPGYMAPGNGAATYGKPPPTYLTWAIIATVGGFLFNVIFGAPFGRIAVRHAREARHLQGSGHREAAAAARKARTWAILSTVMDVLGLVLFIVLITQPAAGFR